MLVDICDSDWNCSYDCMLVVYLVLEVYRNKFWLMVNCIDDVYGDCNLICFCFSIESYVEGQVFVGLVVLLLEFDLKGEFVGLFFF